MTASLALAVAGALVCALAGLPTLAGCRHRDAAERLAAAITCTGSGVGLAGALLALFGTPGAATLAWPVPGLSAAIAIDGLTALFLLPVYLVSGLAAIYGIGYAAAFGEHGRCVRAFQGLLTAGMATLLLARNGMLFLVGWEVMAISAFLLIATEHRQPQVRRAAWVYLVTTHACTLCLVAVMLLLQGPGGNLDWHPDAIRTLPPARQCAVFALGLLAFGLKAGLMPLHVWLPGAHGNAPSHVSAVLSGVLLKMGAYGVLRLLLLLGPLPPACGAIALGLGAASALIGVAATLAQDDLKRLLAYSSIENLGIVFLGIGLYMLGEAAHDRRLAVLGVGGSLFHVLNHSLFKPLLFLCAGSFVHGTGTRRLDQLGGLWRRMPRTSACFLVGAAAISGLPLLNGFASELVIYLGLFTVAVQPDPLLALLAAAVAGALAMVGGLATATFVRAVGVVCLGRARSGDAAHAHESPASMTVPAAVLAVLCAAVGLAPWAVAPLLDAAIADFGRLEPPCPATSSRSARCRRSRCTAAAAALLWWLVAARSAARRQQSAPGTAATPTPGAPACSTAASFAQFAVRILGGPPRGDGDPLAPPGASRAARARRRTLEPLRELLLWPLAHRLADRYQRVRATWRGRLRCALLSWSPWCCCSPGHLPARPRREHRAVVRRHRRGRPGGLPVAAPRLRSRACERLAALLLVLGAALGAGAAVARCWPASPPAGTTARESTLLPALSFGLDPLAAVRAAGLRHRRRRRRLRPGLLAGRRDRGHPRQPCASASASCWRACCSPAHRAGPASVPDRVGGHGAGASSWSPPNTAVPTCAPPAGSTSRRRTAARSCWSLSSARGRPRQAVSHSTRCRRTARPSRRAVPAGPGRLRPEGRNRAAAFLAAGRARGSPEPVSWPSAHPDQDGPRPRAHGGCCRIPRCRADALALRTRRAVSSRRPRLAIAQHDLKRLLAVHSIENIGIICIGLGVAMLGRLHGEVEPGRSASPGALLHVWNHALFKGLLFLAAGASAHAAGTRVIDPRRARPPGTTRPPPASGRRRRDLRPSAPLNGLVGGYNLCRPVPRTRLRPGHRQRPRNGRESGAARRAPLAQWRCCASSRSSTSTSANARRPATEPHEAPPALRWPMFALATACLAIGLLPAVVLPALQPSSPVGSAPRRRRRTSRPWCRSAGSSAIGVGLLAAGALLWAWLRAPRPASSTRSAPGTAATASRRRGDPVPPRRSRSNSSPARTCCCRWSGARRSTACSPAPARLQATCRTPCSTTCCCRCCAASRSCATGCARCNAATCNWPSLPAVFLTLLGLLVLHLNPCPCTP
ncbi:MAG: proton-conducting transporter membrane subunit [Planctomycetota bacterium]